MKQRILLGMSGGTDSSVAAILLMEQGYEVVGITFRFWEEGENFHLNDARNLAAQLGIEHLVYDAREVFNNKIIAYFKNEYLSGRTPFPCVKCNNELKWKLIIDVADRLNCEKVAMGHYVQIITENGKYFVAEGNDSDKDQSFFSLGFKTGAIRGYCFSVGGFS